MKQDRLRATISEFIESDRSDDPVVAILCYDTNVAINLRNAAQEIIVKGLVPADAYEVWTDRISVKGGGTIVFSDRPGSVLTRIDSIIPDDRCARVLRDHASAMAVMHETAGDRARKKAEAEKPAKTSDIKPRDVNLLKSKRKPRSAARDKSEQS